MRADNPQISFADFEFLATGIELDPAPAKIADFIDEHSQLVEAIRQDLERGLKKSAPGRSGMPPAGASLYGSEARRNWDQSETCGMQENAKHKYT